MSEAYGRGFPARLRQPACCCHQYVRDVLTYEFLWFCTCKNFMQLAAPWLMVFRASQICAPSHVHCIGSRINEFSLPSRQELLLCRYNRDMRQFAMRADLPLAWQKCSTGSQRSFSVLWILYGHRGLGIADTHCRAQCLGTAGRVE